VHGDRPGEQEAQAQEKEEEASIAGGDAAGGDAGRPAPAAIGSNPLPACNRLG
jgi:hypothetical protein